jgi:hypothetical protein
MITIDEAQLMLDEIAEELPPEFFKELNGGILLLPERKISPHAREDDLYIMGEYHHSTSMGRMITIYFGSFQQLYPETTAPRMKKKLKDTLLHEFTHHLESLAGERGLEIKDREQLIRYKG